MTRRRVLITGMGCVTPLGPSVGTFFRGCVRGSSGVRAIRRFDASGLACRVAGVVGDWDPGDWIAPDDRSHLSRAVPMLLAATDEALRGADLKPLSEPESTAVLLGSGGGPVDFREEQYRWYFTGEGRPSVYNVPSSTIGNLASELSIRIEARGPSHVISTGCTSSSDALGHGLMMLRSGRADCVVCLGVDTPITPGILEGFSKMRILATGWNDDPPQASRPFDADRNGFVPGEGAWTIVLETPDHLRRRGGPRPRARLRGYGSTCDAHHRVRMNENGHQVRRAIETALEDAECTPGTVDHVQMHGTSTKLNDRVESAVVEEVFDPPPPCTGLKSMIGHPQGASGAAAVCAGVLNLRTNILFPTINQRTPDPECRLDYVPNQARFHPTETVLVNCLGFGSKNAALVLGPP